MWQEIFKFATTVVAVILCGAAVKLVDDFLDKELDLAAGQVNWAEKLGYGAMVYAILLMVFAAGINAPVSLSLFLGSYAVGMFNHFQRPFPSKLNGAQETLVVLVAGIIFFGWNLMFFSLFFVLSVQLIDDCIDLHIDSMSGYTNFAHKVGIVECVLLASVTMLLSRWINEALFFPVLCGATLFYVTILLYQE